MNIIDANIEKDRFKNILKTMVNECEKFANILQRYQDFKDEFDNDSWDKFLDTYTDEEMEFMGALNDRYYNHLDRVDKLK